MKCYYRKILQLYRRFSRRVMGTRVRKPAHAGSWYADNPKSLDNSLTGWLNAASMSHGPAKAIITPHAGYSYSGPTAAFAYKQLDPSNIDRIFLIGPSHHVHIPGCAVSSADVYETPVGDIQIDTKICDKLHDSGKFVHISLDADEREHSLEMQLPYLAKLMRGKRFTLVPIIVGSISTRSEREYGQILSEYLEDPHTVFVISSDFCHWGSRFSYTYYKRQLGEIWKFIEDLDHRGMQLIEDLNPEPFSRYLSDEGNTICGRHPIGVFLNAVEYWQKKDPERKFDLKFTKYAQSNPCKSMRDSSVSYASASLVVS